MAERMIQSNNFMTRMVNINVIDEEPTQEDVSADFRATALFVPGLNNTAVGDSEIGREEEDSIESLSKGKKDLLSANYMY
jgi:hypothetical protein